HLLSFLFSLLSLPPSSTLFPYTTLFRSFVISAQKLPTAIRMFRHFQRCVPIISICRASHCHRRTSPSLIVCCWTDRNDGHASLEDRKSTRLNSSHEWISYAVFCLKKKKH